MQLTCPSCSARNSLEAYLNDDAARRTVAAAARLPAPLGELVLRYTGLFRPRSRALAWPRAARLIEELVADIKRGQVEWKGRAWAAPQERWRQALEEVLNREAARKLTLPLESHGYLRAILAGIADKEEGAAEQVREDKRRAGRPSGTVRSIRELTGEITHLSGLIESSQNDETRARLQEQLADRERELEEVRGNAK